MNLARIIVPVLALTLVAPLVSARIVTSNPGGGLWSEGTTWYGQVPPEFDDDVVIIGPVEVDGTYRCQNVTVESSGLLRSASVRTPRILEIEGSVVNEGVIADNGPYFLRLEIAGDLINAGEWSNYKTQPVDAGDRELRDTSIDGFTTHIEATAGAVGELVATTPVTFADRVDLAGLRLVLAPGSHLTLAQSIFEGDVHAGGNEIRFEAGTYLTRSTFDDAVLVGDAKVAFDVHFTTRVEVRDRLENPTVTGGGAATFAGVLVNNGIIQNDDYSFSFQVHGDIENNGTIAVPIVELLGVGVEHRLRMSPDSILDSPVLLPEFEPATLIAETPVTFTNALGLGVGTLECAPGASLHFGTHSGLDAGNLQANGNTITTEAGNVGLSDVTIDQARFGDHAALSGDVLLTGGTTVLGALTSMPGAAADITVEGSLRVEGTVTDGAHPVRIVALGDIENLGVLNNARVVLNAIVDQAVGVGPGIAVPEFVLESHVAASDYQWYRDGAAMPGETGPSLTFNTLGAADHGVYHCDTDGYVLRRIVIAGSLDVTDVPFPGVARLEQNHPNPFNPATDIAFTLDRSGPVSLTVYDLTGREVDRLLSGERDAGRHVVTWQPRGMASGTYVYRLCAPGVDVSRKCSLLK